ncbi:MAG: polyamine aminopropyltransferase [Candidatus Sumerlaeia bacterium]|nr:polyamine aminopropyltransferase [Candidatus Sumerlaeia bacterium]
MKTYYTNEWFMDRESEHKFTLHRIKEQILCTRTKYQTIKILDTYNLGRILVTDNKIQSAEADEYIYHECLVHPAMMLSPSPQRVLILGGGEGATLREVLKYKTVKKVIMVDIDRELVNICQQYLPSWHQGAFQDKRVRLVFTDALKFIERKVEPVDVLVMDISDPLAGGPAAKLYTQEILNKMKRLLHKNSVFVTQAIEVYFDNSDLHSIIHQTLKAVFNYVDSYYEYIPSYSGLWGFVIGSDFARASALRPEEINRNLRQHRVRNLRYYDGQAHQRLFALPKVLRQIISQQKQRSTIKHPLIVQNNV